MDDDRCQQGEERSEKDETDVIKGIGEDVVWEWKGGKKEQEKGDLEPRVSRTDPGVSQCFMSTYLGCHQANEHRRHHGL